MIISTVCKLVMAMGIGYYLNKKNIFTQEVNQSLSQFIMNIAFPLMIITSMNSAKDVAKSEIIGYIGAGCIVYLAMPIFGYIMTRMILVKKEERPIYELFFVFPNNIFMGYPVAASIYGAGCIFYISVFHLLFNVLFFTYGAKKINHGKKEKLKLRTVINNGTIASVIAITLFLAGVSIPEGASSVFSFVGDLSSPLSMVVIGSTLGTYSLKTVFKEKRLYLVAFIRLFIIPLAVYYFLTLMGFTGALRGIATITMGMPIGSSVSMACIQHRSFDKIGPSAVVLTTILSLVTIPIMLMILG